jgi:HD superfamily phosphodiesterase
MNAMMDYYAGDPKRIQHFLKVYTFAKLIGEMEAIDPVALDNLKIGAIVHDIGIKVAEEKYGSSNGKYQEKEGPEIAKKMLSELQFKQETIDRVCYLIGHHHTYNNIDGIDYQILVEADFLVNLYEENSTSKAIKSVYEKVFKTKAGKNLCKKLFFIADK